MMKSTIIEGDGSFLEMETLGDSALLLNSKVDLRQKVKVSSKKLNFPTVSTGC